jgi:drug/metabolite transporter (DMT)-like permease
VSLQGKTEETQSVAASCAVALTGAIWGVYWWPLRHLQQLGFTGGWTTASFFIASLPPALLMAYFARRELKAHGWGMVWLAIGNGLVFILYSNAYTRTTVFNTLFLFYLSPVWSMLIARFMFGERIGRARGACVLIGLLGLVIMLSENGGWPIPRNLGDWMSLLSGVLWAVLTIYLRRNQHIGAAANTVGFFLGGIIPALLFALVFDADAVPDTHAIAAGWPLLIGVGWLAWLPSQLMLFWGVRRISPVRTGILLMTELVSGVATAAALSGDPVSWHQAVGGALILAAGVGDVVSTRESTVPVPMPVGVTPDQGRL